MPGENPVPPQAPAVEPQTTITNPPAQEGENPTEKRIKDLSGKVATTARERDEALLKAEQAAKAAQFAESFVDIVTANPAAKDFKDQIREKVMGGYTPQDAAFAVLGAAGKLGQNMAPIAPPTGGSAPTALNIPATKAIGEMSRDELRNALLEAQKRGDIGLS